MMQKTHTLNYQSSLVPLNCGLEGVLQFLGVGVLLGAGVVGGLLESHQHTQLQHNTRE